MHTHITISETTFTPQAGLPLLTRRRDWTRLQTRSYAYIPGFLLETGLPNQILQWFNHSCTSESCWISQRPLGEAELQHNCGPFQELLCPIVRADHVCFPPFTLWFQPPGPNERKTCFSECSHGFTTQIKVPQLLLEQMKYSPN